MIFRHVPPQFPSHFPTRIAFIGEAPGDEELEKGSPLVGPGGRVFDSILRTANLFRADFFVGHVFDEKIPHNDITHWLAPSKEAIANGFDILPSYGKGGYLKPEYHHHLDRLASELIDVRPTVIVPLGATALWAFTGNTGISSQRGSIQSAIRVLPGTKLVPTFHPAHVIHQWKFFSVVVADFIKAFKQSDFPEIRYPKKELFIEPTFEELDRYLPYLLSRDPLSVDIETGWGQITNIGFGDADFALNVPFVDLRRPNHSYFQHIQDELRAWRWVKGLLESDTPKLGQNFGGYDAFWILDKMGIGPRNFRHDTRLLHHALYPELPKDLEFMGSSYTEQGAWKNWGRIGADEKRDN